MLRLLAVSLLFCFTALPASANVVRPMEASPGATDLRKACSTAKGTFDISPDGQGYSCTTTNCDGKGGSCTVECDNNNNCNGSTPTRIAPTTLLGILQNGDMVVRDRKTGGTDSLSGPSDGGAPAPARASNPWPDGMIQ